MAAKKKSTTTYKRKSSTAIKSRMPVGKRPKDPPVAYNFKVTLAPSGRAGAALMMGISAMTGLSFDAAFTQISGLSAEMNFDTLKGGGDNSQMFYLPKGVKEGKLSLKRGLASITSPLMLWCFQTMKGGMTLPQTMIVSLPNSSPYMLPVMTWILYNVIPLKWQIEDLDAKKSEIVIESIEVGFSKMDVFGSPI
ncbi:MAG: hypothetical protein RL407_1944 [Bacteroidota bacterium]|jgi:phage tail-like protein